MEESEGSCFPLDKRSPMVIEFVIEALFVRVRKGSLTRE